MSSVAGEPIYNVLLAYLIKDEADVIKQNLEHHYKVGFRNFVIMNNNSSDGTDILIESFKERNPEAAVLILNDDIVGYNQAVKTNAMSKYAVSMLSLLGRQIDWILPVDGDEFFIPGIEMDMKSLFDHAQLNNVSTLVFSWNNAATSDIESPIFPEDDIFYRFNLRLKKTNDYVFKVATRIIDGNEFIQGNHATTLAYKFLPNTMAASTFGSFIFHLHMRTLDHMRRKVINGGRAAMAANVEIAVHWKAAHNRFLQKGDQAIYDMLDSYRAQFKYHGYDINDDKFGISFS